MGKLSPLAWLSRWGFWIALGLLVIVGAWLRWQGLLDRPLWGDEIYTLAHAKGQFAHSWLHTTELAGGATPTSVMALQEAMQTMPEASFLESIQNTVTVLRQNNHPPLWFAALGFWLQSAGISLLTLRLPAYVAGVASIALMGLVGRSLVGPWLGLGAAALWTLSGYQLFQAQNARPYTWIMGLVLVVAWGWLQLSYGRGRYRQLWWPMVVAATILAMHSHYFAAPALLVLWVLGIRHWPGRRRWPLWVGIGLVSLGLLPLASLLGEQIAYLQTQHHFTQGLWSVWQAPELIFRMLNDHLMPKSDVGKWLILGLFVATITDWGWRHRCDLWQACRNLPSQVVWPLWWIVGVVVAQILFDVVTHSNTLSVRRYTYLASPAFVLLLVVALQAGIQRLATVWPRFKMVITSVAWVGFLLLVGANGWQVAQQQVFANPDARLVARALGPVTTAGSDIGESAPPVLVYPGSTRLLSLAWYLPAESTIASYTPNQLSRFSETYPNAWLVWVKPSSSKLTKAQQFLTASGWAVNPHPAEAQALQHRKDVAVWQLSIPKSQLDDVMELDTR